MSDSIYCAERDYVKGCPNCGGPTGAPDLCNVATDRCVARNPATERVSPHCAPAGSSADATPQAEALARVNRAVPESFEGGDARDYIEHLHEQLVTLEGRIERARDEFDAESRVEMHCGGRCEDTTTHIPAFVCTVCEAYRYPFGTPSIHHQERVEGLLAGAPSNDVQACGPPIPADPVRAPAGPPLRRSGVLVAGESAGAGQFCPRTAMPCARDCPDPESCELPSDDSDDIPDEWQGLFS